MDKNLNNDPVPIPLHRPELEIAWRGLVYSIESGYLTREKAVKIIQDWDEGRDSEELPHPVDP